MFIKDLVFYTYKSYQKISNIKNIWLRRLVLCQCPRVSFPSHTNLVDELFPAMVKRTLNLHVFPNLAFATTIFTSFDMWMFKDDVDTFSFVMNFFYQS